MFSVVTSVSVIMDHGNGTKTYLSDQALDQGDGVVGSPVDLLNPDRYEFYTFDETGDLVKRLMTLDQIKGLLATGEGDNLDGSPSSPTFYHESLSTSHLDDTDLEPDIAQGVHSVVASVQNVLKSELEASKIKTKTPGKPPLTIPDSISTWSMLFPAIISDAEALDDGSSSGNSVNDPIMGGDRLSAPSNEDKTEIKPPEDEALKIKQSNTVTEKVTAVPPIIHFLEIQSVPAKEETRTPGNFTATTNLVPASTQKPTITTDYPTSPASALKEMSASISSLMSQVTDDKSKVNVGVSSEDIIRISTAPMPLPTTESTSQPTNQVDKLISIKTPENTNIEEVTVSPVQSQPEISTVVKTKDAMQAPSTASTTTEERIQTTPTPKPVNKNAESTTKKTNDKIVAFVTTSKPNTVSLVTKSKPPVVAVNMDKIQSTTPVVPSTVKNNNTKNQLLGSSKKPTKPLVNNGSELLEGLGTEDILKIALNKQTPTQYNNKKQNHTKTSISPTKPLVRPQNKVPTKIQESEESAECNNSKKTTLSSDIKTKEKLEVAASTNLNEKLKPSNIKPSELQGVKTITKPTISSNSKPVVSKIKPSDDVKVTTYKPSTSQPLPTKQSIHKISTTTHRPVSENKITSTSKIHEVNSSLVDIKDHMINFESNKTDTQSSSKVSPLETEQSTVSLSKLDSAASSIDESKTPTSNTTSSSHASLINETKYIIDHTAEVECNHSKTPSDASVQEKIGDIDGVAASNTKETIITTDSNNPTTITTELPSEDKTEMITETPSKLSIDEVTTTEQQRETATDLPETSTLNMPDVDFVKEGISAVTNILLDLSPPKLEPQLPLSTLPLSESASSIFLSPPVKGEMKHSSSLVSALEMTTDGNGDKSTDETTAPTTDKELLVYFTTTELPSAEIVPPVAESNISDSKNGSTESNEDKIKQVTEIDKAAFTESTVPTEKTDQKQSIETKLVSTAVNKQSLPTKESKLGPENFNETSASVIICNETANQTNEPHPLKLSEESKNTSEATDHLEPAQSIISEVNKINSITTKTPSTSLPVETTPKTPSADTKTASKPSKFSQVKYPSIPSSFRPIQETSVNPATAVELHPAPHESMGLEATTAFLADDVRRFSDLCNELAFRMWTSITGKGSISSRSLVLSPFATTSLLAMVFLGARGPTSGQMNDVLRLDDMVTFNPHQVLQNVTESVLNSRNYGVTTAAFVRELYSDKVSSMLIMLFEYYYLNTTTNNAYLQNKYRIL